MLYMWILFRVITSFSGKISGSQSESHDGHSLGSSLFWLKCIDSNCTYWDVTLFLVIAEVEN